MSFNNDPENYKAMSEPHAGTESAGAALKEFQDGLEELRKKHRIKEVALVVEVNCSVGQEVRAIRTLGVYGDNLRGTELFLWGADQTSKQLINLCLQLLEKEETNDKPDD